MSCSTTSKTLCGTCDTCHARSFATHPKAECWSSKNEMQPNRVLRNSNKKYIFDCKDCDHELEMMLHNINSGQWCKYCNRDGLCEEEDCLFCFQKSFAAHPMAEAWSNKNKKTARQMLQNSDKKCWFTCKDCVHEFEVALYSIHHDKYCPYCANQKLCEEDCNVCFEKSCASHTIAQAWSPLNTVLPRQMFLQSNKKEHFNCLVCHHAYETKIQHYVNRNGSCPYCASIYLCTDTACEHCLQRSFASHPQITCWSAKNTIDPRQTFKGSEKRGIFDCDVCHSEFESKLYNVLTGYWCPYCKNKTESKMLKFLKSAYPACKTQVRFDWCRFSETGNIMPFDFGFDKVLIEVDGAQHFQQVSNWDSPESVQVKDVQKIKKCVEAGYSVIHIYQVDVWEDKYDWKAVIQKEITTITEPCCIFIASKEMYSEHIEGLGSDVAYKTVYPQM